MVRAMVRDAILYETPGTNRLVYYIGSLFLGAVQENTLGQFLKLSIYIELVSMTTAEVAKSPIVDMAWSEELYGP